MLVSLDKYFGDTANVKFRRLTASARPLFRAPRPGHEKTTISIEFKFPKFPLAQHVTRERAVLDLIALG